MFPLGSVLFPYAVLPLRVFEPRYLELTHTCLQGDGRFGVVLIERGYEVGGGDTRFSVGTVARIVEAARTPEGRYLLATVGTERFRVRRWLDDDPYPRADVEMLAEPKRAPDGAAECRDRVERLLVRSLAMRSELGESTASVDANLDADPIRASYEAASLAPIGALDAQRLLEFDDPLARLAALEHVLVEEIEVLEFRLAQG